ncbi:MAG: hypothetical protein CMH54_12560 [Myxococcales bacterium]|mgnify:CR=1 FL=1|nr:hypothetical protein [Myxococcales bacterium]
MTAWLHRVLGVNQSDSRDISRVAYARLLKNFHPDLCPNSPANQVRLELIRIAFAVMSEPELMQEHARTGKIPNSITMTDELTARLKKPGLGHLARGFVKNFRRENQRNGKDIVQIIYLDYEELIAGSSRIVELERAERCNDCSGSGATKEHPPSQCHLCDGSGVLSYRNLLAVGLPCPFCDGNGAIIIFACQSCDGTGSKDERVPCRLSFPAGVDEGHRIVMKGEGERGVQGGRHGDRVFLVRMRPEEGVERHGKDVEFRVQVAANATSVTVPWPEAGPLRFELPDGDETMLFIAQGLGFPTSDADDRGDVRVHVTRAKDQP